METNDPALIKTPINNKNDKDNINDKGEFEVNTLVDYDNTEPHQNEGLRDSGTINEHSVNDHKTVKDDSVMPTRAPETKRDDGSFHDSNDKIEDNTTVNKGTDTFEEEVVDSKHVNDGDNPARQPDRRDQEGGSPFDGNVNEETVGSEAPQSQEITDMNRYASVDNAQTRILNPDEKD